MQKILLKTENRNTNECVKNIRHSKMIPCVVYWHKFESTNIKVNASELLRTYRQAWKNHIISLEVNWKNIDVLIHETQFHPVSWDFLHVDFYAITKWEKVYTEIPLIFVWISQAKTEWAIIEELLKELKVKCLPTDLIDIIEVDISKLEKIGDIIKISDLNISDKIEIENDLDDVVILASKPKVEKTEEVKEEVEVKEEETK